MHKPTSLPGFAAQGATYICRSTHETLWLLQVEYVDLLVLRDVTKLQFSGISRSYVSQPASLAFLLCLWNSCEKQCIIIDLDSTDTVILIYVCEHDAQEKLMVCSKYTCKSCGARPVSYMILSWKFSALCMSIYRDYSNTICLRIEASIQPRFELMFYLNNYLQGRHIMVWLGHEWTTAISAHSTQIKYQIAQFDLYSIQPEYSVQLDKFVQMFHSLQPSKMNDGR